MHKHLLFTHLLIDRHALLAFVAVVLLLCAGCDRAAGLVKMSGKVTVDGKPLTMGVIFVAPDKGRAAGGKIGKDGSFTLSTYKPGDGVLPGTHRVQVVSFEQLSPTQRRWFVPKDVRELSTTRLKLDVTGHTDSAEIAIATNGEKLEVETTSSGGE